MNNIAAALIQSLKFGLSIWDNKESRKYLDEVLSLEKKRLYEENKPEEKRNHAILDNIDARLCLITETVARFGESNSSN